MEFLIIEPKLVMPIGVIFIPITIKKNSILLTAWAKYLKHESIDVLRKEIIEQLISSNRTLQEIKKEYL